MTQRRARWKGLETCHRNIGPHSDDPQGRCAHGSSETQGDTALGAPVVSPSAAPGRAVRNGWGHAAAN